MQLYTVDGISTALYYHEPIDLQGLASSGMRTHRFTSLFDVDLWPCLLLQLKLLTLNILMVLYYLEQDMEHLSICKNLIPCSSSNEDHHVGLSNLNSYGEFLSDGRHKIREYFSGHIATTRDLTKLWDLF
ncbi:hypothetical protein DM860_014173 [Cuscuta australis]|uniref:Uncharacterized protein n=1 Tax=Cuscuta australis TaxID=267555 RepID=A0A328DF09_9ASTE|nr:hypothetical protein DM860_014173 [Cuscuta australis]